MKKKQLLFLIFMWMVLTDCIQAQHNEVTYQQATEFTEAKYLTDLVVKAPPQNQSFKHATVKNKFTASSSGKYSGLYIGVKTLPLKAEKSTIILKYTDESPTPDPFYGSKEIKKSSYALNLNLTINGNRIHKMPVDLDGFTFGLGLTF